MSEEEIIKYAKIFSNAKGDTYKINFVNENKTIDEVEIWKEILKLIDKKDKVIEEATNYIENHKTPLGNYLMSPSEIEVLLEILRKQRKKNDYIFNSMYSSNDNRLNYNCY